MTYVDGEPLGKVRTVPLYRETYLFLSPDDGTEDRTVTWEEAATSRLCLLSPVMQNRRILDGHFADSGAEARPVVETDSISAIYAHVASMGLSSVIPHTWLHGLKLLAIHLCIGQVYATSVYKPMLVSYFDASLTAIGIIFSIAIVMLGLSAAVFGTWVDRVGPRRTMFTAACCWSAGFLVAAAGIHLDQLWLVYLGYGVIGGIGLGLG